MVQICRYFWNNNHNGLIELRTIIRAGLLLTCFLLMWSGHSNRKFSEASDSEIQVTYKNTLENPYEPEEISCTDCPAF